MDAFKLIDDKKIKGSQTLQSITLNIYSIHGKRGPRFYTIFSRPFKLLALAQNTDASPPF